MKKNNNLTFSKAAGAPTGQPQQPQFHYVFICVTPTPYQEFIEAYRDITPGKDIGQFKGEVKSLEAPEIQRQWKDYYQRNQSFERAAHILYQLRSPIIPGSTILNISGVRLRVFEQEYIYNDGQVLKRILTLMD